MSEKPFTCYVSDDKSATLKKVSTTTDFLKERKYTHINRVRGNESMSCIWLETYGIKSFMIECKTTDVDSIITRFKLKPVLAKF